DLGADLEAAARAVDDPGHRPEEERDVELVPAAVEGRQLIRDRLGETRQPALDVLVALDDEVPVPLELAAVLAAEALDVACRPDVAARDRGRAADRRAALDDEYPAALLGRRRRRAHAGHSGAENDDICCDFSRQRASFRRARAKVA